MKLKKAQTVRKTIERPEDKVINVYGFSVPLSEIKDKTESEIEDMYFEKSKELKAKEYALSSGVNSYFDPVE